jgi:hypothetical protein
MKDLATIPPAVDEALALAERFDAALLHGFGRLGEEHREHLEALAGVFAGSPLESAVSEAVAAVGRSEFVARSFLSLASARVALLGAVHDALVAQACGTLGRPAPPDEEAVARPAGGSATGLASAQQWLTELAIAGLKNLEESSVAPFAATLEGLEADPELTGLAALLLGFSNELLGSMPLGRHSVVPAFRWGDLWSAAMVRTQQLPPELSFREVSGVLTPIGLDVQSHEHFVCVTLWGVFDDGQAARTVRVPFAGYKVGAIGGAEVWDLFEPFDGPILEALKGHKTLRVSQAELRANGDLVLRTPPEASGRADPFAAAGAFGSLPCPPLARHPVHIAEPVLLAGEHGLPLALERLPRESTLSENLAEPAPELIGLLRFDRGGWRVQPLCVRWNKGFLISGEDLAAVRKKQKTRTLEVLRERAARLLRARS